MEDEIKDERYEFPISAALGVVADLMRLRNVGGKTIDCVDLMRLCDNLQFSMYILDRSLKPIQDSFHIGVLEGHYPLAQSMPYDTHIKRVAAVRLYHAEILKIANKVHRAGGVECTPEIEAEVLKIKTEHEQAREARRTGEAF